MPRVTHFEIIADDAEVLKKFYTEIFDWKVRKWDGPTDYWFLMTGESSSPGIDGAFSIREPGFDDVTDTIDVDDIDKYIALVEEHGGEITRPKNAIPGVGWLAYFKDTEGNLWGMMQDDSGAK